MKPNGYPGLRKRVGGSTGGGSAAKKGFSSSYEAKIGKTGEHSPAEKWNA